MSTTESHEQFMRRITANPKAEQLKLLIEIECLLEKRIDPSKIINRIKEMRAE